MIRNLLVISVLIIVTVISYTWKTVDVVTYPDLNEPPYTNIHSVGVIPQNPTEGIGDGSGVDFDSEGNVYFLHRAGYGFSNDKLINKDVVNIYSKDYKSIGSWGANIFKSPHGITIDNEDNVWVTDIMQNKVFKFDKRGILLKEYGDEYPFYLEACLRVRNKLKNLPCFQSKQTFARPTDVEVFSDGSFVVADGYRNSRIARFTPNGELKWEVSGIGNHIGELYLPHDLAMDSSGNLYVADRKNSRVQIFSSDGVWLDSWEQPEIGRPYGLDVSYDNFLYLVDAGDSYEIPNGVQRSQLVKLTLDGDIVDRYSSFGNSIGEMDLPHDVAVSNSGHIIVAEINNQRLQIFELHSDSSKK